MDELHSTESDRRRFLKRAGIVAGSTVWATPVVQSLSSAAFAAGSPTPCTDATLIRFKYEAGKGFDSGKPNPDSTAGKCTQQVIGYHESLENRKIGTNGCFTDGACTVCVTVTISNGGKTATITVSNGTIYDADIKGGSDSDDPKKPENNGYCSPGSGPPNGGGSTLTLNVPADRKNGISFVAGTICPNC